MKNTVKDAFLENMYNSPEPEEKEEQFKTLSGAHYPRVKRPAISLTNEELVLFIQNNVNAEVYKTQLVQYNTPLVYKLATNYYTDIPFDDKIQYGFLGLMEAVQTYTYGTVLFSTYASTCIQQNIKRHGNHQARIIDFPEKHGADASKIKNFITSYSMLHDGKTPSNEVISTALKMSISDIKRASEKYTFTTFDTPVANVHTLTDILPDNRVNLNIDILYDDFDESLPKIISELHEKDQELINRLHGFNGYEGSTIDQIYKSGFSDKNGKEFKSAASLYRYYHLVAQSMKRSITKLGLDIKEPK